MTSIITKGYGYAVSGGGGGDCPTVEDIQIIIENALETYGAAKPGDLMQIDQTMMVDEDSSPGTLGYALAACRIGQVGKVELVPGFPPRMRFFKLDNSTVFCELLLDNLSAPMSRVPA